MSISLTYTHILTKYEKLWIDLLREALGLEPLKRKPLDLNKCMEVTLPNPNIYGIINYV